MRHKRLDELSVNEQKSVRMVAHALAQAGRFAESQIEGKPELERTIRDIFRCGWFRRSGASLAWTYLTLTGQGRFMIEAWDADTKAFEEWKRATLERAARMDAVEPKKALVELLAQNESSETPLDGWIRRTIERWANEGTHPQEEKDAARTCRQFSNLLAGQDEPAFVGQKAYTPSEAESKRLGAGVERQLAYDELSRFDEATYLRLEAILGEKKGSPK